MLWAPACPAVSLPVTVPGPSKCCFCRAAPGDGVERIFQREPSPTCRGTAKIAELGPPDPPNPSTASRRFKTVLKAPMSCQTAQGRQLHSPWWAPVTGGAAFISSWDFRVSYALSSQKMWGCPGSCRQCSWQCSRARLSTDIGVGDSVGSGMGDREKSGLR